MTDHLHKKKGPQAKCLIWFVMSGGGRESRFEAESAGPKVVPGLG